MYKKLLAFAIICGLMLTVTAPAMAILKVLDPAVSAELRTIAVAHLAQTHNVSADAITIEDTSWLREFWNIKVDVYMIDAVINQGLANEQKALVSVRVDQKIILQPDELKALEDEEYKATPAGPQARIMAATMPDVSGMELIVNNERVTAPPAYINDNGIVMVPLRAIAEALEINVIWDGELRMVMLDYQKTLIIGTDSYSFLGSAPIQLGTAPEIVNGRTFVPLNFFREVLQMNNAYVFEAQIVIDDGEKMY